MGKEHHLCENSPIEVKARSTVSLVMALHRLKARGTGMFF
jgi:hypothetical protein